MSLVVALISVVLLNGYAATLISLRSSVYRVPLYRPMLVNIGLSFAPVLFAFIGIAGLLLLAPTLSVLTDEQPNVLVPVVLWTYMIVGTLVWLLFFPNSVYLITELNFSHRQAGTPVPLWYDIVQTLALTMSGIANAVLSLAVVQTGMIAIVLDANSAGTPPAGSWLFAGIILLLGAVGVYLGRYLRFNSWDVKHPIVMVGKLRTHLTQRGKALEALAFVVTHTVLIALVYVPLYAMAYAAL